MKKRTLSMLLALAMLFTVLPLTPITAGAVNGTKINEIGVTVTPPTLGKTTAKAPSARVPADAGCTVTATEWVDAEYGELSAPLTFEAEQTYYMSVVVETEEGYFCTQGSSGTSVAVTGGNLIDFFIFNMSDAEGNPHSTVTVYVAVQAAPPVEIDAVTLAVTPLSAGRGSTDAESRIAVTAEGIDSYYATWKEFTGYAMDEPTELDFVEGRTYYAVITFFAADGYTFKKGAAHSLDFDACDYSFGGSVNITGGALYKNYANVRSTADPEYMKIWITVTAGPAAKRTVSFDPGTGTGEMASVAVSEGSDYALPACTFTHTNAERAFYKWSVNGELKNPGDTITVTGDVTVTAKWRYTGEAVTADKALDKSTVEVLGTLTLTETRAGEAVNETVYDETTAGTFVNPSSPTVNAMIEEAKAALAEKAAELAGGSEVTTVKDDVTLKVAAFKDERTFTYSYLTDEAGDYYYALTIEGEYYKRWQYTVALEAEYEADEETPEFTLGDVDGKDGVTAADARLALRAAVGLENYAAGSREFLAADVDKSETITAADARLILRRAVKLTDAEWGGKA